MTAAMRHAGLAIFLALTAATSLIRPKPNDNAPRPPLSLLPSDDRGQFG
jgi:hypothetical protein